ncbi:MAG: hypothetical protein IT453_04660 [Planctomycetes bacterium]|nr:hypothetical protein [Planctomycetota bacterium]
MKSPPGVDSKDLEPASHALWGDVPQAHSHVGLVHAAFTACLRWPEYGS